MNKVKVQVVTCSNDSSKYRKMRESFEKKLGFLDLSFHRIEGALSMEDGYSKGMIGRNEGWYIFCHDDIVMLEVNEKRLLNGLKELDVLGPCGTRFCRAGNWYDSDPLDLAGRVVIPGEKSGTFELEQFGLISNDYCSGQALDGIFIMARVEVADKVGFERKLPGFTGYDISFTYRSHLAGFRVGISDAIHLLHESKVKEFSEEKMKKWQQVQSELQRRFNFRDRSEGRRKHLIVPTQL